MAHDGEVAFGIAGGTDRSAHRMPCDEGPRDTHLRRDVTEGADVHPDRRDADGLDGPLNVPDRHVADRSNGDEQDGVDLLGAQDLGPLGCDTVAEPQL
ncbi:MAG: hypothetical protein RIR49_750 [Actinomycetota bacterium]